VLTRVPLLTAAKLFTFLAALSMLLVACGGKSESAPRANAGQSSAGQVVEKLKARGIPIGETETYTADNDPNHLLGRPNQYLSKSNFHDTRLKKSDGFDTSGGGSVEVFSSAEDAQRRAKYIEGLGKASPMFVEYGFTNGVVLLRVSKDLTPDQAREYERALEQ
jgi:hypothetical protein